MRLEALKLSNFRAYGGSVEVKLADLTAFIGRNDAGKSSVLEALAIFFESSSLDLEPGDRCVFAASDDFEVRIGCVFSDLPDKLVVDSAAETTLADEHLLNADGLLEIHKIYDCSSTKPKPRVIARALHPTRPERDSLLTKKNADLKRIASSLQIDNETDRRSNVALRRAIWGAQAELARELHEVPLDKEGGRAIWEQLQSKLPLYALFRADRASTDDEAEIQDPMRLAVREALQDLEAELSGIKEAVRQRTLDVAVRTLAKLHEFDPTLASELTPLFKAEPKWDAGFKLSLTGDDAIPINKRGSGVRRLILLSFFRAEAERRLAGQGNPNVIYAVEEPETSQHPDNQQKLIKSFCELSEDDGCQVVLTTHVPGLARLLPVEGLRFVNRSSSRTTAVRDDDVVEIVADALGVLPAHGVRVVVCVEGPHDITFLKGVARLLISASVDVPDLATDRRIVIIPLGGSTLQDWVNQHHLRHLGLPEVHLYDRDQSATYKPSIDKVNQRGDGSIGFLTQKREIENYLHSDSIHQIFGVKVPVTDTSDVVADVHAALGWGKRRLGVVKRRLNSDGIAAATIDQLRDRGGVDEIVGWFSAIKKLVS